MALTAVPVVKHGYFPCLDSLSKYCFRTLDVDQVSGVLFIRAVYCCSVYSGDNLHVDKIC